MQIPPCSIRAGAAWCKLLRVDMDVHVIHDACGMAGRLRCRRMQPACFCCERRLWLLLLALQLAGAMVVPDPAVLGWLRD
jgi:hypothetical protein